MDDWTPEQKDWMQHLVRIGQDRLKNPVKLSDLEVRQLKWEIGAQQQVLTCITNAKAISDMLGPVAAYMRQYADLHIEWYAGRITGEALRKTLLAARAWMIDDLRRLKEEQEEAKGVKQ